MTTRSRRDALRLLGTGAAAALLAACGRNGTGTATATTTTAKATSTTAGQALITTTTAATPPTAAATVQTCVLTPEMTEGPYYLADEAMRSDVTEGRPGAALQLDFTVVDAATCTPIPGAVVEIWHADAAGDYSGFGSGASSRTFLRGGQTADAKGAVTFRTIYPGWYPGRAVHIHLKVHANGATHTSQLFFDEAVSDQVYGNAPYDARTGQRTRNSQDGIYQGGGAATTVAPARSGGGYRSSLVLAVAT